MSRVRSSFFGTFFWLKRPTAKQRKRRFDVERIQLPSEESRAFVSVTAEQATHVLIAAQLSRGGRVWSLKPGPQCRAIGGEQF
jgi:hypothetical protein